MIENLRDLFVKDLLGLVSIESVTGDKGGIDACFRYVEDIAKRFGFCFKCCAGGKVLEVYPVKCTTVTKIGIVTHVDTVPVDEENWVHNPYGEVVDGRVYGRGVIDDKMGVLYSLYVFKDLEGTIDPSWKLIIGSSEEGEWTDMADYIAEGNMIPGFVFTIDGDGIQHGCRGTMNVRLVFERNSDSRNLTMFDTVGGACNIVPGLVSVKTYGITSKIQGKSVHSSIPEKGVNAIIEAYLWYAKVIGEEFEGFGRFMDNCIKLKNGGAMFIEEGGRLITHEEVPGNAVIPTMCALDGDVLTVTVNVRISPTILSKKNLIEAISRVKKMYECDVIVDNIIMPGYIYPDSEEIVLMQDAYEKVVGRRPKSKVANGTGYNATFPNAALFGPRFDDSDEVEQDLCHCPDESRLISDIEKFYDILKEYIRSSLAK